MVMVPRGEPVEHVSPVTDHVVYLFPNVRYSDATVLVNGKPIPKDQFRIRVHNRRFKHTQTSLELLLDVDKGDMVQVQWNHV